jgi:hypothetical protein
MMFDQKQHPFCNEFYVVESTIEVVVPSGGQSYRFRIQALRDVRTFKYSTSCSIEESINARRTYPRPGDEGETELRVWASYPLPWTNGDTAQDVLNRALAFLEESI